MTLTGPGGIGKTRLATEAAIVSRREFPDGVFFVSLAPVQDAGLFASAVASALGIAAVDRSASEAVVDHLRAGRALLVLDTLEHMMSASGEIAALVSVCPTLTVLATSREALRLRAEIELPLPPLEVPQENRIDLDNFGATSLFLQRARAIAPDLPISRDISRVITEICARLEGVPLAIELAAARVKHLTLPSLRDHLDRSLDVLTGGSRDLPVRQRAMRDTVAWSYDLLEEEERSVLRALSVFAGGCSLEAARAVWRRGDPLPSISALIDKNLLRPPEPEAEEPRYQMLDVVREFAAEQRDSAGETAGLAEAHARCFLRLAEQAEPELGRAAQREWMRRLDADRDNLRGALRWVIDHEHASLAQRIAGAIWQFWRTRGDLAEGRMWLQQALAIDRDPDSPTRAKALWGAAWLAYHGGDYGAAGALSVEFLAFTRRGGNPIDTRNALTVRGMIAMAESRYAEALVSFEECVAICSTLEPGWLRATSFLNLATALMHAGDPAGAEARLEEALALYEELGDRHFTARARSYIGHARSIRGDHEAARQSIVAALQDFRLLEDAVGMAEALESLAAVDAVGDPALAAYEAGAAQRLREGVATRPFPFDARFLAARLEAARAGVDAHVWDDAWKEGRDVDLDAAIERCMR